VRTITATSDLIGQALSLLCMIHCAATPLVLAVAPAAIGVFGGAHPVLLVLVLATAAWSFVPGYRHHHQPAALMLGLAGVALLSLGTLAFHATLALDIGFTVTGAALMLVAHWKNRTAHRHCACQREALAAKAAA
jgi:hypothetical protein